MVSARARARARERERERVYMCICTFVCAQAVAVTSKGGPLAKMTKTAGGVRLLVFALASQVLDTSGGGI